ncbi:polysaccharide pyruvyl transferase family protein [Glycomyces xiaoerkulensis]|uniref:polysaccharide pyruvyl transferase family protein n=1 Tax=Glycomyces xiaoerkulensis TaxID=2038139 RepID=UPI000C2591ED|nr:polysaccharide pyruvyl transferase family protein [Glycomyces xiaoerkulensis]
MKRILIRAAKHPFEPVSALGTIKRRTIATNVGNLLFSDAVFKHLTTPEVEVHINGPQLNGDPRDAERINEEYDAFVVPLANAFRPSFKGPLSQMTKLIKRLRIPVVVPGVGAQTGLAGDLERLKAVEEEVIEFVRAVLDRSATMGVRGELTADYLASLGFKDHVEVIGCPAMFAHGKGFRIEKKVDKLTADSSVALSYSPASRGLGAFQELVESMLSEYSDLTYFPQNDVDLEMLYWGDTSRQSDLATSGTARNLADPILRGTRAVFPIDPRPWMDDLAERDFAIGTRIHGNMAAILAGTPAYVMAHDSRTLELARYLGIPHRDLSKLEAGATAADLYEELDFSGFNAGYYERYERYIAFLTANGLDNCFDHGDGGAGFERRKRETNFPRLVESWADTVDEGIAERIAWLNERVSATEKLEKRVAELEATVKRQGNRRADASLRQQVARRMKRIKRRLR